MAEPSRKKRMLLMPEGTILAHVGRMMALADALDPAEFEVSFAASGRHAERLEGTGRRRRPVYTRPREDLMARLGRGGSAFDTRTVDDCVASELRVIGEAAPDIVVGDFRPSLSISARVAGVKYVSVVNAVWTRYYACPLDPPESWLATRIFGKRFLKKLAPLLEGPVFAHYARPFNRVRARHGLPPQRDIRDCMCSDDLTLVPDLEELFPHVDALPGHVRYVAPIVWEPDVPEPPWTTQLDRDRPIVYVTMGSTGPLAEIKQIVTSLAAEGFQVVCTTATEEVGELPDGCYGTAYAPGGRMCELADVVVCHAGNGTIYQSLSRGKPVVGVPDFHDQEFNMQRVEAQTVGLRALPGPRLAEDIVSAVRRIMADATYREQAARFRTILDGRQGAQEAAERIAELAG